MRLNFVCARALLTAFSVTVLATACGGGGGDSTGQQQTPSSTNHNPTISGSPPTSATVGQAYSFTPTASDSDGDTLTYSVANQPAWMSINASTGQLTGTPTATGSFPNITITVSDGKGGSASLGGYTLAVNAAAAGSSSVTLNWAQPDKNSDGSALQDLASYTVLYGQDSSNLNQSKSVKVSEGTSTTIDNLASGTWYFAVVSVNTAGAQSQPTNVASKTI